MGNPDWGTDMACGPYKKKLISVGVEPVRDVQGVGGPTRTEILDFLRASWVGTTRFLLVCLSVLTSPRVGPGTPEACLNPHSPSSRRTLNETPRVPVISVHYYSQSNGLPTPDSRSHGRTYTPTDTDTPTRRPRLWEPPL